MKIAIEAQRIFRKNKHGMDFVALEMIRKLQIIDKKNQYYIIVAPGEDECLTPSPNFKIIKLNCPTYILWEQIALPQKIKKIRPDILHCTSNTAPLSIGKTNLIVTLHDIIYLEKKQGKSKSLYQTLGWHYRKLIVPRILHKCKYIITVSEFERQRIMEKLSFINPEKLFAIYNGYSKHFSPVKDYKRTTSKYTVEDGYILFLGNTDPKKNTEGVIKAYAIYLEKSTKKKSLLILDIKGNYIDDIIEKNNITKIKPHITTCGYIKNTDLPAIYSGASFFLYPSLRESFGIPILESMACGTPVITSETSAMKEIAGSRGICINPYNENDIAENMLKLEEDKELYKKQTAYGLERVKIFTWENTAKKVLEIYNRKK